MATNTANKRNCAHIYKGITFITLINKENQRKSPRKMREKSLRKKSEASVRPGVRAADLRMKKVCDKNVS